MLIHANFIKFELLIHYLWQYAGISLHTFATSLSKLAHMNNPLEGSWRPAHDASPSVQYNVLVSSTSFCLSLLGSQCLDLLIPVEQQVDELLGLRYAQDLDLGNEFVCDLIGDGRPGFLVQHANANEGIVCSHGQSRVGGNATREKRGRRQRLDGERRSLRRVSRLVGEECFRRGEIREGRVRKRDGGMILLVVREVRVWGRHMHDGWLFGICGKRLLERCVILEL